MYPFAPESRTGIGNLTHGLEQRPIYLRTLGFVTLRTARLIERLACLALRYLVMPQTTTHRINGSPAPLGVYKFGRAASLRISMSRA